MGCCSSAEAVKELPPAGVGSQKPFTNLHESKKPVPHQAFTASQQAVSFARGFGFCVRQFFHLSSVRPCAQVALTSPGSRSKGYEPASPDGKHGRRPSISNNVSLHPSRKRQHSFSVSHKECVPAALVRVPCVHCAALTVPRSRITAPRSTALPGEKREKQRCAPRDCLRMLSATLISHFW